MVILAFRVAVAFGDEWQDFPLPGTTLFISTKPPYSQRASAKLISYKPISTKLTSAQLILTVLT